MVFRPIEVLIEVELFIFHKLPISLNSLWSSVRGEIKIIKKNKKEKRNSSISLENIYKVK